MDFKSIIEWLEERIPVRRWEMLFWLFCLTSIFSVSIVLIFQLVRR